MKRVTILISDETWDDMVQDVLISLNEDEVDDWENDEIVNNAFPYDCSVESVEDVE